MKNQLIGLLMLISIGLTAQNPLGWSDGNFPSTLINVFKADNPWLENGDSIYSAFMVDDKYYASAVKVAERNMVFLMAFGNTGTGTVQLSDVDSVSIVGYNDKIPVKVGFNNKELIYWGVCRDGIIYKLEMISKKNGKYGVEGKFALMDKIVDGQKTYLEIEIQDNPYYSLNPVWPENLNYRLKMPDTLQRRALQRDFYLYNMAYPWQLGGKNNPDWQMQYPKYVQGGSLMWEIFDGKSTVKNDKKGFLNQAKFRIAIEDLRRGYMLLKLTATPLPNSKSTDVSRIFKIYWQ
jgi:hypothetical protein